MSRNSAKAIKPSVSESLAGSQSLVGGCWTQWIEPGKSAEIAKRLPRSMFIIKNHGPESAQLTAQDADEVVLDPGTVRATQAYGSVIVENKSENRIMIEFEFLPIFLR